MVRLLILAAVTGAIFVVMIPLYLTWINMRPEHGGGGPQPSDYGMTYETLDLVAMDGVAIKAWLIKPAHGETGAPCIIMVHGKGNSKSGILNLAAPLWKAGYNVMLPDLRGHGESADAPGTLGLHEAWDVAIAVEAIKRRADIDSTRIGVYAQSMGTAAALLGLANEPAVRGWVIDSGFGSLDALLVDAGVNIYGVPRPIALLSRYSYKLLVGEMPDAVRPADVLARSNRPCLFFHARDDRTIPIKHGRALFNAAAGKKIFIENDGDHVSCWGSAPEAYEKHLVEFFRGAFSREDYDPAAL